MRQKIEKYINENYEVLQEYPWTDYPEDTTFKHIDNKKWFGLIMVIPYARLKIDKTGTVDILNVKCIPEMIGSLRQEDGILPAYHMNKEHWITILLDGTVATDKICNLIDLSYDLTSKK